MLGVGCWVLDVSARTDPGARLETPTLLVAWTSKMVFRGLERLFPSKLSLFRFLSKSLGTSRSTNTLGTIHGGGGTAEGEFQAAWARVNLSLYTALGNSPLGLIDAFGLDPGDHFPNPDEAGKDAACYMKKKPSEGQWRAHGAGVGYVQRQNQAFRSFAQR